MKAIVYDKYGSPDVLQLQEVDKPVVRDDDVLVRVHAAAANPADWHTMRGTPYLLRLVVGLLKPKVDRLGIDLAGHVEAVGKNVTQFRSGDVVFGSGTGAFAEYVRVPQDGLAPKPANATFEQAAAVPIAAFTALQSLRDNGQLQPGQKVLINGAAGGVGTFGVQIAKAFGAEVTGVCSSRNVDRVRKLGADHVTDYTQADFTRGEQRYDLIFDAVGNRPLSECRRVLASRGRYVLVGAPTGDWIGPLIPLFKMFFLSLFGGQKLGSMLASPNKDDLLVMKELIESGKVTPVIDRHYKLNEVPDALRYLEEGHAQGKVVIIM